MQYVKVVILIEGCDFMGGDKMEFIEFVEKIAEQKNIVLLPYQKEIIKKIYEARKEGKEIKIFF